MYTKKVSKLKNAFTKNLTDIRGVRFDEDGFIKAFLNYSGNKELQKRYKELQKKSWDLKKENRYKLQDELLTDLMQEVAKKVWEDEV